MDSVFGQPLEWSQFASYASFVLLFCAYFLVLEAIFLSFARRSGARSQVSRRLATTDRLGHQPETLIQMRQRRSLSAEGHYTLPLVWLNRLIVQSGVSWGAAGLPFAFVGTSAVFTALLWFLSGSLAASITIGIASGAGFIVFVLSMLRKRRQSKLESQLPEAIDVFVRGLRAGHPVSAAIRLVGRELPDPIGSEFKIAADEMTYGLDLETAMNNMSARVGQQDLALVVIAIGIQVRTGGNLAEILGNMSNVVRERLKLRMKARALSAEGRMSAIMLSLLPIVLFGILLIIAPSYYGEVWDVPVVKPLLIAAAFWMIVGNFIMSRMVNFEI